MSQYEQDLKPLIDCIDIIFNTELTPFILTERKKYQNEFLNSDSSKRDFTTEIKKSIQRVLDLLSKTYISKLKNLYFSEEGLTMFIFASLYKLSIEPNE